MWLLTLRGDDEGAISVLQLARSLDAAQHEHDQECRSERRWALAQWQGLRADARVSLALLD